MFDTLRTGDDTGSGSGPITPATGDSDDTSAEDDDSESEDEVRKTRGGKKAIKKMSVKKTTTFKTKKPTAKTSAKKAIAKTATKKTPAVPQHRLLREMVPELGFKLSPMDWSAWQPMISKVKGPSRTWEPRPSGDIGFRNKTLFTTGTAIPAVYEVAVQPRSGAKRYPVYYRATGGFKNGTKVDKYLLNDADLTEQADTVLKKGCKLFVRRARIPKRIKCHGQVLSNIEELKSLMAEIYDYPWCSESREVYKTGVYISKEI